MKKAWDKFKPAITKKQKAAKQKAKDDKKAEKDAEAEILRKAKGDLTDTERAQKKLDDKEKEDKGRQTKADARALDFKKDDDGIIIAPKDAEEYKKISGKAPDGWAVDPEEKKKDPKTNKVITKAELEALKAKKDSESESLEPKVDMKVQESNELQAIMALDDAGIKADINRKGQVTVKKKDLKKAEKALAKSFKKGGAPKLVGESVKRSAFEVVSEARTRSQQKRPDWEPEKSEPKVS